MQIANQPIYDTAVLVGRFQVADLHDGHVELLQSVSEKHRKLIVVLGVAPVRCTYTDPLDFETRKLMIQELFPEALIVPLADTPDDSVWSRNLDALVRQLTGFHEKVVMYGARDSFLPYYNGAFPTLELIATGQASGTDQRYEVARKVRGSADFRAGVITATQARYPVALHTVDVAVFDDAYEHILLGRKEGESTWCFPGGFVDPGDDSAEAAASRELREETGLTVSTMALDYIGSYKIDDFRYRKGPDKIITTLYAVRFLDRVHATADDDLAEVAWCPISWINPISQLEIKPNHKILATAANFYAANKKAKR